MFEQVVEAIANYDPIIIHRHRTPDGDCLGAQIGLKHLITENYPGKRVFTVGDKAGRYDFMADSVMDTVPDEAYKTALAVIVDTPSSRLVSDQRFASAAFTVRIDHHLFTEKFAQLEVVDTSFESCCGQIAQMAMEAEWRMPLISAESLFTGIVTDSGRFRYDSISSRTFSLVSYLMRQPINTSAIYQNLYIVDLETAKIKARFVQKIQLTKKNVAYIYTTREEIAQLPIDLFSISRGMVSVMNDLKNVDLWVNFTEAPEGVICELRSSRFNINPIAVKYGGGGHKKASGATIKDREEAMKMLDDLNALAEENK